MRCIAIVVIVAFEATSVIAQPSQLSEPIPFLLPPTATHQETINYSPAVTIATVAPQIGTVQPIASTIPSVVGDGDVRIVRYDIPITDMATHNRFAASGLRGKLIEVASAEQSSAGAPTTVRVVRYEVPDDQILLHSQFTQQGLHGDLVEVVDSQSWKPQVRFLQPKARVFFDLKRDNDSQFDLFRNGSLLASLDLLEIYKPLKFVTDFFAEEDGKAMPLHDLGWRFGATVGLGLTTAISNSGIDGGAPIGVASMGLRYEFPIGPEPPLVLDQSGRPIRLDQRTRVGFEAGMQVGTTTNEDITDRFDAGLYVGLLVNTPW